MFLRSQAEAYELSKAIVWNIPYFYTDDGEFQDGTQTPTIDYRRDSLETIAAKRQQRSDPRLRTVSLPWQGNISPLLE
jgi:hypothetical protein